MKYLNLFIKNLKFKLFDVIFFFCFFAQFFFLKTLSSKNYNKEFDFSYYHKTQVKL